MVQPRLDAALNVYEVTSGMARGEEEAYREFYEAYCDRLFRYLLVMARGNEEFCRDILQNTMVKIVRYVKPFEKEEVFWSWLTQVARTTFIDGLRKQLRQPNVVELPPEAWPSVVAAESSSESLPLIAALEKGLEELPADERMLIKSIYFEETSQKKLAASEGRTPKAIESHLARIRQKLRQKILNILKHEERI